MQSLVLSGGVHTFGTLFDDCNTNSDSRTSDFGCTYANDTRRDGKTVFTGSGNFKVKEIEIFEITD
jgi:hypothetical protein